MFVRNKTYRLLLSAFKRVIGTSIYVSHVGRKTYRGAASRLDFHKEYHHV